MKKFLITAILICVGFTSSLFSLEWGGLVNNTTTAVTGNFKNFPINQSNGISLWLKSSLNKDKSLSFATEAMYKYNLLINGDTTTFTNIVDLSLLKLSGHWAFGRNNLFVDIGRFPYSDMAGAVFAQNSDGVGARFGNMEWNTGLYVGYTGLLNRFTVGMSDPLEPKETGFYDFCYRYIPILADFTFANLKSNRLAFQLGYFLDLTSAGKNSKGLFEISASGPVGYIASYSVNVAATTENFKNVALFSNFDMTFYISEKIMASFGADYTSGDHGFISLFMPVTYRPIHNSQSVTLGADVIVPRLTGMFVLGDLFITANEKVVMSVPKKGFKLNGLDTSVSAVYNVFSDLQLSCTIDAYVDLVSSVYHNFSVILNAGFAF